MKYVYSLGGCRDVQALENVLGRANVIFGHENLLARKRVISEPQPGQLILTDRRLIFIKFSYGEAASVTYFSQPNYANRIEEGLQKEGSFVVPIEQVVKAEAVKVDRFHSYVRLGYRTADGERLGFFNLMQRRGTFLLGRTLGMLLFPPDEKFYDTLVNYISERTRQKKLEKKRARIFYRSQRNVI